MPVAKGLQVVAPQSRRVSHEQHTTVLAYIKFTGAQGGYQSFSRSAWTGTRLNCLLLPVADTVHIEASYFKAEAKKYALEIRTKQYRETGIIPIMIPAARSGPRRGGGIDLAGVFLDYFKKTAKPG